MLGIEIQNRWKETVKKFADSPKGRMLEAFLRQESERGAEVYPPNPFRALQLVSPESVRVVILGQDPYHTPGVADGLAFSVGPENRPAPSLRNIFKEIQREYGTSTVRRDILTEGVVERPGNSPVFMHGEKSIIELEGKPDGSSYLQEYVELLDTGVPETWMMTELRSIIMEEAAAFFNGDKSAKDAAALIQNKVQLYLDER